MIGPYMADLLQVVECRAMLPSSDHEVLDEV